LQQQQGNKKGIIIFGAIVLIFLAICLLAYIITGDKGIEERFSNAVGLPSGSEEGGDNGILGFTLEGNHIYYVIILALVIIATVLIYLKYKV
jgi:amino acid permease